MPAAAPNYLNIGAGTDNNDEVSLLEIIDNILNSGVVIQGSIVISLAGVDLVYVGLNVVLTSVETALKSIREEQRAGSKHLPRK